jgi:hypothetical protein
MTNPKESGARTEVGPHNRIDVAMEDLPKAEEGAREGTRGGDGQSEVEEARMFPKNTHGGDQENCPSRHDYGNSYIYGNS